MANQAVVTIGTFDGVHRGHQAILAAVSQRAKSAGLPGVAFTFGLPPRIHSRPSLVRTLLLPEQVKHRLLLRVVDRVEPASFVAIADLTPREFAERILLGRLNANAVVVGHGFRFGKDRSGDVDALFSLGVELGFEVVAIPPLELDGGVVSSTRIRNLVSEGRVREAGRLLGRPHLIAGLVDPGERIGHSLGYPTANVRLDAHVLPPKDGIYLVHAFASGERAHGLLYIGTRPTLRNADDLRCEVHFLSAPQRELYGHHVEVHVLERLREDRTFPSLAALRQQIARDVEAANRMIPRYPLTTDPISG